MKQLLTILCLVFLVSCSNEVPPSQLVERQRIKYEINSTTPFTGSSVSYYKNGQLGTREDYKNGKPHGVKEIYFENGQLERKTTWKNGNLDGLWEYYYENGQLRERGNLRSVVSGFGRWEGFLEYFDEDGNLTKTEEWKEGKLVE
jgi:antitoxin component YwqK of YwqJK toxin-antitoxin module